jgi:DNA-directed RNA polymerase specialized sigma24 family protein
MLPRDDEFFAAAVGAIVEALYAADEPPTAGALIRVGRSAAADWNQRTIRARGINWRGAGRPHARYGERAAKFVAYWHDSGVTAGHEAAAVEHRALAEIWSRLTADEQATLAALAEHGDYQTAADAVGVPYRAFYHHVWSGRRRFRELWHEGESPSGQWRRDVRAPSATLGSANHNAKLDAEQVAEMRSRHADGVAYKELAADYGVAPNTVRRIVRGQRWRHTLHTAQGGAR